MIRKMILLGDFDDETWTLFQATISDLVDLYTVEGTLNAKISGNYGNPAIEEAVQMAENLLINGEL